jgi:hypothetical protein
MSRRLQATCSSAHCAFSRLTTLADKPLASSLSGKRNANRLNRWGHDWDSFRYRTTRARAPASRLRELTLQRVVTVHKMGIGCRAARLTQARVIAPRPVDISAHCGVIGEGTGAAHWPTKSMAKAIAIDSKYVQYVAHRVSCDDPQCPTIRASATLR